MPTVSCCWQRPNGTCRACLLVASELGELELADGAIRRGGQVLANLRPGKTPARPRIELAREMALLAPAQRNHFAEALALWLEGELAPLEPLRNLEEASRDPAMGSEVRALLLALAHGGGLVRREEAGLAHVPPDRRKLLRRIGVTIGTLDIFVAALLKPGPRRLLQAIDLDQRPLQRGMAPVITPARALPAGYRRAGNQAIRVDMAEKIFRTAHDQRTAAGARRFTIDPALATSMGLAPANAARLLHEAGFCLAPARKLAHEAHGPPAPDHWGWRAPRSDRQHRRDDALPPRPAREGSAFAALAALVR